MRFKGVLIDTFVFTNVLNSISHMCEYILVHFLPNSIRLCSPPQSDSEYVFYTAPTATLFHEYRIESKNDNEIGLLCNVKNLLRALQSGEQSDTILMKLTKKMNCAYLSLEMTNQHQSHEMGSIQSSASSVSRKVVQDISVAVQTMSYIKACAEPALQAPRVKIHMPPMKSLALIVDRFRNITDTVVLSANNAGEMRIRGNEIGMEITTYFKGLSLDITTASSQTRKTANQAFRENDEEIVERSQNAEDDAEEFSHARVSLRKLQKVLAIRTLQSQAVLACWVDEGAFVIYVKLRDKRGTLTCYVPILVTDS